MRIFLAIAINFFMAISVAAQAETQPCLNVEYDAKKYDTFITNHGERYDSKYVTQRTLLEAVKPFRKTLRKLQPELAVLKQKAYGMCSTVNCTLIEYVYQTTENGLEVSSDIQVVSAVTAFSENDGPKLVRITITIPFTVVPKKPPPSDEVFIRRRDP